MESRVGEVVQGYSALASSLLERWGELASGTAAKLQDGGYDMTSMAEDMTAGASLATEGGLLWMAQTLEALTALYGLQAGPNVVTSQTFHAPAGATLTLAGPLVKGPQLDELPVGVVSIEPSRLGPTETEFTLRADGSGHRGATYVGQVNATTGAGTTQVTVWVTVP